MRISDEFKNQVIIPVFKIGNFVEAKNFYVEKLGFNLNWTDKHCDCFPAYSEIEMDGAVIHLTEEYGFAKEGMTIMIKKEKLKEYLGELNKDDLFKTVEIEEEVFGNSFMIEDPWSNRIHFWELTV